MKNKDLLQLNQAIDAVGNLTGCQFAYAMARNKNFLKTEIELLQEAVKPSSDFIEYETKRIELCEKMADKDKDNKAKTEPIIQNNKFVGSKYVFVDIKKFEKEVEKLQAEYKKAVDTREKQLKEYAELLEKESSFVPYKVKMEFVPKEITVEQFNGIIDLICEE